MITSIFELIGLFLNNTWKEGLGGSLCCRSRIFFSYKEVLIPLNLIPLKSFNFEILSIEI